MLAGEKSVCAPCHENASPEGQTAVRLAESLNGLDGALQKSEAVLAVAERYGMDVSEAQLRLLDGKGNLVKARLALHTFKEGDVRTLVDEGMMIAKETSGAGEAALHEKDVRRLGLAVSVVFIVVAILAIRLLIRRVESRTDDARRDDIPSV